MTNLAGKRPVLAFFNRQTSGIEVKRTGLVDGSLYY